MREHEFVYKLFRLFVKLLKTLKALLRQIQASRGVEKCCRCLSGGEAGEPVHEDVVTFGFLSSSHTCVWSEMLFQLSCFCCRWVFHCRWGPQTLTRTCRGYLPRCCSGKGEGKQGRQEQSSSTD